MNTFVVVAAVISIALTLVVIFFAWRTVREAKKAGEATEKAVTALNGLLTVTGKTAELMAQSADAAARTVTALKDLLTVTEKTAELMAQSAEAAHETATIAKAARDQAEYDRKLRALMEVEELTERIFQQASVVVPASTPNWRCALQNFLAMALRRIEIPLPESERLAGGMSTAAGVAAQARDAQREAETKIRHLMERQPES
jgi:hypothetical protein